jgi:hypothetical protein
VKGRKGKERGDALDGNVSGGNTGEERLLVEVDTVKHREGEGVVTEEDVNADEAKDREVTEVVVEGDRAVLAGNSLSVLALLGGDELVLDPRLLDERVEDVEDRVAGPDLGRGRRSVQTTEQSATLAEAGKKEGKKEGEAHLSRLSENSLLLSGLSLDLTPPKRERSVLVHKLVDDVVDPVDRESDGDGSGAVEDQVEEDAVVLVRRDAVLEIGLEAGDDVAVVELAVEGEEDLVCE